MSLEDKIKASNAVCIAAQKLLNKVLKVQKANVGKLPSCIQSVNTLKISSEHFGESLQ